MPQLIRMMADILAERQSDTYFLDVSGAIFAGNRRRFDAAVREHMAWFRNNRLKSETAAPRGWLEGNPYIYAVYFDDNDDPRLAAYTAEFETPDGKSLKPEIYQMQKMLYAKTTETT